MRRAEITGLAEHTQENLRSRGSGPPFYEIGARVLYDADELSEWLATKRAATPPR